MRYFPVFSTFVLVFSLVHALGYSQSSDNQATKSTLAGNWEAGVLLGPDFYFGDLNSGFYTSRNVSAAGGLFIMRQFTNVTGLKAQIAFGGLRGSRDFNDGQGTRTYSFTGSDFDFTANVVFNLSNLFSPYHAGRHLFIYASLGLGVTAWNSNLTETVNGEEFIPDQNGGIQVSLVVPLSFGLQYSFTEKIRAGIEYSIRPVASDMLDQKAGGLKYDAVNMLSLTASFRFGKSKKALKVEEYPYAPPDTYQPGPYDALPADTLTAAISSPPVINDIYLYAVQVCAYAKHQYSTTWVKKHYHLDYPVRKENEAGLERFIIGHFKDFKDAKALCEKLRKKGIRDAWVIAYKDGKRHHVVAI